MNAQAYGFDPSFRHGALVLAQFQFGQDKDILTNWNIVYSWSGKTSGFSPNSPASVVFSIAQQLTTALKHSPVQPVAIDWEPQSVYWRASRLQVVQLGMFLGYVSHGLHSMGFPTVYLTPTEIRKFARLKNRQAEKSETHVWFRQQVDISAFSKFLEGKNTDFMDATILAYVISRSLSQGVQCPPQI